MNAKKRKHDCLNLQDALAKLIGKSENGTHTVGLEKEIPLDIVALQPRVAILSGPTQKTNRESGFPFGLPLKSPCYALKSFDAWSAQIGSPLEL